MKTPLLLALATLAALGTTTRAQETPPPPLVPPAPPAAPAPGATPKGTITVDVDRTINPPIAWTGVLNAGKDGKVTITLNTDGHQETREIDLDKSNVISINKDHEFKIRTDGDKAAAPRREKIVWVGVTPDAVPDDVRAQLSLEPGSGIILRRVSADSPAAKAGLQKNDVLTKCDDQLLLSEHQFRLLIKGKHDGDVVHVVYLRHGQPGAADVTVGTVDPTNGNPDLGSFQFSFDNDSSIDGEEISKNVNAVVKNAMKTAMGSLNQSKAIVMDKAGKMVKLLNDDMVDVDTTLDAVDKAMHRAGIDEKTIADTKRQVAEELKHDEHSLEKAQEGLKKAAEGLKKAAAAQAKTAGQDTDDEGDN